MKKLICIVTVFISFSKFCMGQCPPVLNPPTPQQCAYGKPCGIYVIQNVVNDVPCRSRCKDDVSVNNCYQCHPEYYDGIMIKIQWDQLQPTCSTCYNPGVILKLRNIFEFAATNWSGVKRVSIGVIGGNATPPWAKTYIQQQDPTHVFTGTFHHATQFGALNAVSQEIIDFPVPWDFNYQFLFNNMITGLHNILNTNFTTTTTIPIKWLDLVNMVKLTGVNLDYVETRLPNEDDSFEGLVPPLPSTTFKCADNWVQLWTGTHPSQTQPLIDPYTPSRVQTAFEVMADHISTTFAGKYVNLVVVRDPHGFPPIDCNGLPYPPNAVTCNPSATFVNCTPDPLLLHQTEDPIPPIFTPSCHTNNYNTDHSPTLAIPPSIYYGMTDQLINDAIDKYAPCLAVNSTSLSNRVSSTFNNSFPNVNIAPYALIGYQQLQDFENDWHPLPHFKGAIENGLGLNPLNPSPHANFIELFPNTINFFADPANNFPNPPPFGNNWMDWAHRSIVNMCGIPHRLAGSDMVTINSNQSKIFIKNESTRKDCYFEIYDMLGKKLINKTQLILPGENSIEIKSFGLDPAVYIFKLHSSEGEIVSIKFIVN